MDNKVKKIIFHIIEFILIICMIAPFICIHIYTRQNGVKFKYRTLTMIGSVLICVFLMWVAGKLLGMDTFVNKSTLKPNWVNFGLQFIRIFAFSYANTTSEYTATYARCNIIDKNQAIQKIYTLWIIAIAVVLIFTLAEMRYNKKREIQNEN